jgi:hypothetical protein
MTGKGMRAASAQRMVIRHGGQWRHDLQDFEDFRMGLLRYLLALIGK